ncbi:MAG: choice-of-anchor Q domain-containing protein, partial [Chloroflexota bacterium]
RLDRDRIHIQSGSAAIDAGLPTSIGTDIDNEIRPSASLPDIGADEFVEDGIRNRAQGEIQPAASSTGGHNPLESHQSAGSLTGSATTILITPDPIDDQPVTWTKMHFYTDIISGTGISITLLDENNNPVPGFEGIALKNGPNDKPLNIDGSRYPSLKIQAVLNSESTDLTPQLLSWGISWNSAPTPRYRIYGDITDGNFQWLSDMSIQLLQDGEIISETATDQQGTYLFENLPLRPEIPYTVRAVFQRGPVDSPILQIFYGGPAKENEVIYVESGEFMVTETPFTTLHFSFDLSNLPDSYTSNVPELSHLDDIGAIFVHINQALSFILSQLEGIELRPLKVFVFRSDSDGVIYLDGSNSILIGASYSDIDNPNRPMNREWHETFHGLMADSIGIPAYPPCPQSQDNVNHGGWTNCSTTDSWIEGWAEFWAAVLAEHQGWPQPWLYQVGYFDHTGSVISLEYNYKASDQACADTPPCRPSEEIALAGLLWDIHDGISAEDDDFVDFGYEALWETLTINSSETITDVKHLYEILSAAGVGSGLMPAYTCDVTQLDQIFINHGFFFDRNGDGEYQCDSDSNIGAASDPTRPDRRDLPIAAGMTLVNFDSPPNGPVEINVSVDFPDAPYYNYTYSSIMVSPTLKDNLVYFELPPISAEAIMTATFSTTDRSSIAAETLVLSNQEYWNPTGAVERQDGFIVLHSMDLSMKPTTRGFMPLIWQQSN